jgi:hypothetical protein
VLFTADEYDVSLEPEVGSRDECAVSAQATSDDDKTLHALALDSNSADGADLHGHLDIASLILRRIFIEHDSNFVVIPQVEYSGRCHNTVAMRGAQALVEQNSHLSVPFNPTYRAGDSGLVPNH